MTATTLGRLLGLVAVLLFGAGFVVGSVGPPLAAVFLLAYRRAAARQARAGEIHAVRHAPPVVGLDRPFEVVVEATVPAGLPLRIDDVEVPGTQRVSAQGGAGRGSASLRLELLADAPGRIVWASTDVVCTDPWGVHSVRTRVPAPGHTQVAPSGDAMVRGRRMGRRSPVQTMVKGALASDPLPEFRMLRPYLPADLSRDIDWRTSTRLGELVTRERERAMPRSIIVFLDATRSMRRAGRVPKLRTAVEVAIGVAGLARGMGVEPRIVAFHERGVHMVVGTPGVHDVVRSLSGLPAPEGTQGFRLTTDLDRRPTVDERRFMQQVAPLAGQPAAPSLERALQALRRVSPGPALVVAIMDGEVNPTRAEVAVSRLQRMGHQVMLVVPATGAHHATRQDAPLAQLREAMARRQRLGTRLAARHAVMVVALPGQEARVVQEVAKCAV